MPRPRNSVAIFGSGLGVGALGGLIGLGGAEFRLPVLIGLFGFRALPAVIINKAVSLVVVASALPFRAVAGSLSLVVSLPTMLVGFRRYSRDQSFEVIRSERRFLILMAAGSLAGAFVGAQLLGVVPAQLLLPMLAGILVISAVKVWRHA